MAAHIIDGDKGGVGKSFIARAFADNLINRKTSGEVIIIDCDPSTPDVVGNGGFEDTQVINGVTVRGILSPVASQEAWFRTVDSAAKHVTASTDFVFSLPAGAGLYIDDTVLDLFGIIGPVMTIWAMGKDQSSVDQLRDRVNRAPMAYERGLIALNEFHGLTARGTFDLWSNDNTRKQIVRDDGWREFRVPVLNAFVTKLTGNMPLHRAVELSQKGELSPTVRVGVEAFRRAFAVELNHALEVEHVRH
ncbi:hypothetical protein MASR1M60_22480 [Rhodocyclaceae bacterium]